MWEVNWWDVYGLFAVNEQQSLDWVKDTELALEMLKDRDPLFYSCVFTPHKADNYLAALWGARLLLSHWFVGKLEIAVVETNSEPPGDRSLPFFSPKLPYPFEIELWGGIDDFDGVIKWSEPVPFMDWQGNLRIHPAWAGAPVEVGECHPMKVWFYLVQGRYLARYPYRWKRIVIFALHPSVLEEILDKVFNRG